MKRALIAAEWRGTRGGTGMRPRRRRRVGRGRSPSREAVARARVEPICQPSELTQKREIISLVQRKRISYSPLFSRVSFGWLFKRWGYSILIPSTDELYHNRLFAACRGADVEPEECGGFFAESDAQGALSPLSHRRTLMPPMFHSISANETKPPRPIIRWSRNLTLRSFAASRSFAVASMSDYGSAVLVPDRDEDGL